MDVINPSEQDERSYLDKILQRLEWALERANITTGQFSKEFRQNEAYLYDQKSGMDDADRVSALQSFKTMASRGESTIATRRRLTKLSESPYFGRIDFSPEGPAGTLSIYIGMYSFVDGSPGTLPIYDWRAPVSSMFYDFELGDAWYQTPAGIAKGRIDLRRQYRIRHGKMEYMIENAVNIQDDVLQKELSQSSDDKMKTIVATIQRDQNAIIRNETAPVMIIQGVAGSGKTSIAIHRIAFLLYRFKDSIKSNDILIISPNKVFADYISNVLPELGEAQIPELGMDELAHDLLNDQVKFHTPLKETFSLLAGKSTQLEERIQFKSSIEFITHINRYLVHLENNWFKARDLHINRVSIPTSVIQARFNALQRVPLLNRIQAVIPEIQAHLRSVVERKLTGDEKGKIHRGISQLAGELNLLELYKQFYQWLGRPELLSVHGNLYEYSDVFPIIYLKMRLEGIQPRTDVKHLVVDEMQDYTPIQYTVLSRLFPGKKTILGDASQTVNPFAKSTAERIQQVFPQAEIVKLLRSYRSTYEITRFSQRIKSNPEIQPVERHGPEPEVKSFQNSTEELAEVARLVEEFRLSDHNMLAIICKTPSQVKSLMASIQGKDIYELAEESSSFREGIAITTAPMAKGLEFDEVIVPFVSQQNYQTETDRNLLYVACTRAMHRLAVTNTGMLSPFLTSINT